MEQLADAGDGNYAYIDSLREARKVLVDQLSSTLKVVAKDVKLQVEFNPAQVSEYRLLGYENRALKREDFSNDKVDAGEIGAGHTVTALYEIVPVGGKGWLEPLRYQQAQQADGKSSELAWLRIRYKAPGSEQSKLLERPIAASDVPALKDASEDLRFATAVAAFAQQLKGGQYTGSFSLADSAKLARGAKGEDRFGLRGEHGSSDLSEPITDDDAALLRRYRHGDAEAFGVLYARHRLGLSRFLCGVCRDA
eukprot:gene52645-64335_t